jgi:hypothetical protein
MKAAPWTIEQQSILQAMPKNKFTSPVVAIFSVAPIPISQTSLAQVANYTYFLRKFIVR